MVAGLGYATILRWKKSPGRTAGYYVRYRETSAPVWQGKVFTADTSAVLNVSKDEYLFGIQAVDGNGNASLVTIPAPVWK